MDESCTNCPFIHRRNQKYRSIIRSKEGVNTQSCLYIKGSVYGIRHIQNSGISVFFVVANQVRSRHLKRMCDYKLIISYQILSVNQNIPNKEVCTLLDTYHRTITKINFATTKNHR